MAEVKGTSGSAATVVSRPFAKIEAMCAALPSGDTRQRVVLLMTGSLNPVHKLHMQSFEIAKRGLEQDAKLVVVGGLLSASHDDYVGRKVRADLIPFVDRAALCRLAVNDSKWVDFDEWEGRQAGFRDFPAVARHVVDQLNKDVPKLNLRVLYLCGSDHCAKCHLYNGISRDVGVCVVARPGAPLRTEFLREGVAYLVTDAEASESDVSSTLVRQAVVRGDANALQSLKRMLHADVLAYMVQRNLLGMSKFKAKETKDLP